MCRKTLGPVGVCVLSVICFAAVLNAQRSGGPTEYRNNNYGYSVRLPANLAIQTTEPPGPNHGFGARLSASSYLWVDGSFPEAADTLDEAAKEELEHQPDGCTRQQYRRASLANTPAVEVVLKCPADSFTKAPFTAIEMIGFQQGVKYIVGLRYTDANELTQSKRTLQSLISGFRFIPRR